MPSFKRAHYAIHTAFRHASQIGKHRIAVEATVASPASIGAVGALHAQTRIGAQRKIGGRMRNRTKGNRVVFRLRLESKQIATKSGFFRRGIQCFNKRA